MNKSLMRPMLAVMLCAIATAAPAQTAKKPAAKEPTPAATPAPAAAPAPAGPKANPRYVINGDEVYDKKTDLTWARCSVGQKWKDGIGCVGLVGRFDWNSAQRLGQGGWRVPSKDELTTLIDHTRKANGQKPTIDEAAFPDMDLDKLGYWTSTPDSNAEVAWLVSFFDGSANDYFRRISGSVRLLRGGQ